MRRAEREIKDKSTVEEILRRATVCRLAVCDGDIPYVVPLHFGYESNGLYFHSAPEGRKMETIKANPNVCFEVDVDQDVTRTDTPCNWEMKYRSVIGFGKAHIVDDPQEKRRALKMIVEPYSGDPCVNPESALRDVAVVKIQIESMTGEKSRILISRCDAGNSTLVPG